MKRLRLRHIVLAAIASVLAGLSPGNAAMAATVDIVVDSADIQLESGQGGTHAGKVTLSNISAARVNVDAALPGDDGCSITPNPTSVSSGRRTQISLTFGAGCDVEDGADVRLDFGAGVNPPSQVVKVTAAPETEPNWDILSYAFLIAAGLGLAAVLVTAGRMVLHNNRQRSEKKKLKWGTRLEYLGTDWSFKDNWVGNVTIGSAALVALLAASDVLTAVLGNKPEAALGLLAVSSALAAVFVAIGPLLMKAIGDDASVPTVGGMLVAASVTLLGSLGQVTALTWQGAELTSGDIKKGVIALGLLIGAVILWYAIGALWDFAEAGSTKPRKKPSEAVTAAEIVATAIRELEPSRARRRVQDEEEREPAEEEGELLVLTAVPVAPDRRNALL